MSIDALYQDQILTLAKAAKSRGRLEGRITQRASTIRSAETGSPWIWL